MINALKHGPLGFQVVDLSVALIDGSYHTVDSSDMAFQTAARIGIVEGLPQCQPVLLEPIHLVEIVCPTDATAKMNAILSGRRGQILGFDTREGWDGWDVVRAKMPESEIGDLIIEVRSATAGVGSLHLQVRPHGRIDRQDRRPDRRGAKGGGVALRAHPGTGMPRASDWSQPGMPTSLRRYRAMRSRIRDLPVMRPGRSLRQPPIRRDEAHERHSPPRLGNARKPRHARASVLQSPRVPGRRSRRGRREPCAELALGPARHRPARSRRSISIPASATRSTRSTGRSPTRRSTATTTISTSSAPPRSSPRAAQALKIRPWTVKIDGMVEKPFEIGIDDLVRKLGVEERLYRHRCVEAWSMAIPWSGFPMAKLVELAKPLSSAKYVRMETFLDKSMAPGQQQAWYPVALCRGAHHGGGHQRARLHRHRRLRQADRQAARRADPAGGAVEVRLQVDQVDRALLVHRQAAEGLLGGVAGVASTASGPTSIRRWRIRAGARPARN